VLVGVVAIFVPLGRVFVGRRAHPDAIVLKACIDVVGVVVIHGYGVNLADIGRVAERPVLAVVVAYVKAAIVAIYEVAGLFGVNPKGVMVGV
jgi:drug/metabolite transporter (DMT)-like permease